MNVYNCSWQLLPFTVGYPTTDYPLEKPVKFAKLIALAEKLAEDIDYCRVDMYATDDEIYFSEITLAPCNGRIKIKPLSWDFRLGELWESAKDKSAEEKIVRFFGGVSKRNNKKPIKLSAFLPELSENQALCNGCAVFSTSASSS
ncbi:ATP-grasp fold amidoligase family protein [Pantoea sp. LMR881]|uniref:ATP-grasp fold amidoligase family protein n=1 Tax=Pantoea sp. LMR881 TaxID=3014336 RepID=UPI0022B04B5E|nr:ATP-grasp fold amidoligase family protein [Pantoea sp. LMR881]MCZ4057981.1 ATP-grasp fold amidoligase family protein [Pantoea sp. LMR881]